VEGAGFPGQGPEDQGNPATPDSAHGSGLRGVSEPLSALGGRLSLGPADGSGSKGPGHGFRLIATVPTVPSAPITGGADAGHTAQ